MHTPEDENHNPISDKDSPKAERNKAERQSHIYDLLHEKGHVSVTHLSTRMGVSEVTIRKDLKSLEDSGVVVRTRGGAVLAEHYKFDLPFRKQMALHAREKNTIGQAAASFIKDHDTIILSSGSTTAAIVPHLSHLVGLTIFTNSIRIANQLIELEEVELLMPGGFLYKPTASIVGPYAKEMLNNHRFNKAFMAMDGCDNTHTITSASIMDAALQQTMIDVATETFIVADASKFGRNSLHRICHAKDIQHFITDSRIQPERKEALESLGCEVTIA